MSFLRRIFGLGVSLTLLCACAPLANKAGILGPMGDALVLAIAPSVKPDPSRLPKGFEYMQVTVGQRHTLMALGERRGAGAEQADEFWYSPQSELVHLRNGRLWRVVGMTTEWREQQAHPPAWSDLPMSGEPVLWHRRVDRMPGYRWQDLDRVQTRRLTEPPNDALAKAVNPAQWFEESVQATDAQGRSWHYTQRFALRDGAVFYSEQCIARDLCVSLTKLEP